VNRFVTTCLQTCNNWYVFMWQIWQIALDLWEGIQLPENTSKTSTFRANAFVDVSLESLSMRNTAIAFFVTPGCNINRLWRGSWWGSLGVSCQLRCKPVVSAIYCKLSVVSYCQMLTHHFFIIFIIIIIMMVYYYVKWHQLVNYFTFTSRKSKIYIYINIIYVQLTLIYLQLTILL
jgi:hypothetical protein